MTQVYIIAYYVCSFLEGLLDLGRTKQVGQMLRSCGKLVEVIVNGKEKLLVLVGSRNQGR